jgi:hypothetical protein
MTDAAAGVHRGALGLARAALSWRRLIERDPAGQLHFTNEGRAVFKALVADELE